MWIVIRKSDNLVVGTCQAKPPAGAWNKELFEVKEWDGPEPLPESLDPTLDNPRHHVPVRFSTEELEILDVITEGATEQAALKVQHGGKVGWIHIHATE